MSDQDAQQKLRDTFMEDVPRGALITSVREDILPARTWVKVGADGVEIYLDAEQAARLLVRTVRPG